MFGSSKSPPGQPPERTKAVAPATEQFDDIPPMPEIAKPVAAAAPKKTFNFAEKPKPAADDAAHLYIGANIRLKGEIAGCDLMRVEGVYEGIAKSRQLVLCPGGSFLGTAEIEDAEIEGTFEGALHVRGRLFLRKQGKIRGTFSYGQLEIERGGEIDGRILPFDKNGGDRKPVVARPADPVRPADAKPIETPKPAVAAVPVGSPPASTGPAMTRPAAVAKPLNGAGVTPAG